ncbi:transporter substrate-binding domain-containing protein [Pseudomonas sp. dw_358]|uniref:transporter substrate-binding domain-containing protein n=1 Tax=Pseudomonas sp. dw_358 TaxID=2720083 RepID=UPI001BD48EFC|nr:transporter substrate-binding domain-containing protein [Pseudomonas sp. dw_358]
MYKPTLTSLALIAALLLSNGASAVETLKMGMEADHLPFNGKDASGQVVGFDVDIGNALCAKMKVQCEIVTADWDTLIPELNAGQFNFLMSSLPISPERLQVVDFTDPYYSVKLELVAAKSSAISIDKAALAGKVIGAQRGTAAGKWLQDNVSDQTAVMLFDTQEDAYQQMVNGSLDAVLSNKYVNYEWLKSVAGKDYEAKGDAVGDGNKIGIALRKGDPLRDKLNTALHELIVDGTYKKINDRYFPFNILQ